MSIWVKMTKNRKQNPLQPQNTLYKFQNQELLKSIIKRMKIKIKTPRQLNLTKALAKEFITKGK